MEEEEEEDNSRQEEARKVLDAIRQQGPAEEKKEPKTEKIFARLPSEDAAELENLISNTILAKNAPPPPPPPEEDVPENIEAPDINPISTDQIKVMRKVAANKVHAKKPILNVIGEFILRSYYETLACFNPVERTRRCQQEGHVCANCGVIISPAGVIQEPKNESGPSAQKKRS